MFVSHIGAQRMLRNLFVPFWIAYRDGVINLARFVFVELHVERAMRFGGARKDHHARCGFVEAMDDPNFSKLPFKHFYKIPRIFFPAIGQNRQSGGFVENND